MAAYKSTDDLIYAMNDPLADDGCVNGATTNCQHHQPIGRPLSMPIELISVDVHNADDSAPHPPPPCFVMGPYNHRKRLLSCIVENWSESDSYTSLPAEVNQSPLDMVDSAIVPMKKPFWEAEDAVDYITTLDEACILDIESCEDIDKLDDQQKWMAQTYGPIYEPLLKPGEDFDTRTKSANYIYDTGSKSGGGDTSSLSNGPLDDTYAEITRRAGSFEKLLRASEAGDFSGDGLHVRSTDNLLGNGQREEDFLYFNPAYNRSKCRTPLQIISLNSSFCDESTSMNSSLYEANPMTSSQLSSDKSNMNGYVGKGNTINPLENSIIEMGADRGDEQMQVAAENGKFLIQKKCFLIRAFACSYIVSIYKYL